MFDLLGGWPLPERRANAVKRDWESLPAATQSLTLAARQDGCIVEHLLIENSRCTSLVDIEYLPAIMTLPVSDGPHPVVIYCHAHGGRYDIGKQELLAGRSSLPCGDYGRTLAHNGVAALCIDLPCFGERAFDSENALAKRLLWHGNTLFGVMLRELANCIDYLEQRSDVDSSRLGSMGLSMGSTLAWWLAALDDRVKVVAELCCLADMHSLVSTGGHDRHGLYMMIPQLLQHARTSDINALIAPRPHFSAVGELDMLTPMAAFERVDESMKKTYARHGQPENWQTLVSLGTGHEETEQMRSALLAFLAQKL
ncbi:MAG: alpha/beta hydrolase family protein [Granulosicoccus sp.]